MPIGSFRLNTLSAAMASGGSAYADASGGTVSLYIDGANIYKVHKFLTPTAAAAFTVTTGGQMDILLVGAGGSAAGTTGTLVGRTAGGGGGGRVITQTGQTVASGSYNVYVGAGAPGGLLGGGTAVFGYQGGASSLVSSTSTKYNLTNATPDGNVFPLVDTTPEGIAFSPTGNYLFGIGSGSDLVRRWTLSTPWNVSTAGSLISFSVAGSETIGTDIYIKSDGTKYYIVGSNSDFVREYNMSTAWDVTTSTLANSFAIGTQAGISSGLHFSTDGTKMYVLDASTFTIYQYNLSTAWNVSTASYSSTSFSFSGQDTLPNSIRFNSDGTKLFMLGDSSNAVHQYSLSTAWSINTLSYDSVSFSINTALESTPRGLAFSNDGSRMYFCGSSIDRIVGYYSESYLYRAGGGGGGSTSTTTAATVIGATDIRGAGGGGGTQNANTGANGGVGVFNGGNPFTSATASQQASGGGAGSGAAGGNGASNTGGLGGNGTTVTGFYQAGSLTFGGGGGGAAYTGGGSSGGTGGGASGSLNSTGGSASSNTGGGGGGVATTTTTNYSGGAGGSGLVAIRYLVPSVRISNSTFIANAGGTVTPSVTTGKFGNGLAYSNSNTYGYSTYNIGSGLQWNDSSNTTPMTFEFWFKSDNGTRNTMIMSGGGFDYNVIGSFGLYFSSGLNGFYFRHGTTDTSVTYTANTWAHVAIQVNSSRQISMWFNGTTRLTNVSTSTDTLSGFNLGAGYGGSNTPIGTNTFDEVRISYGARYTPGSSLTVPTAAFTNDSTTLGLFHCTSTTQTDNGA